MTNYYKVSNKFLSKRDTLLLAIENARESKHSEASAALVYIVYAEGGVGLT